jgi:hypothetical protein
MDWLEQNPVRDAVDSQILTDKVLRLGKVLVRRARERKEQQSLLPGDGPATSFGGSV